MTIDLQFIRVDLTHLYCKKKDRLSVAPTCLFNVLFLSCLFIISSELRRIEEVQANVVYRWFQSRVLTEDVSHHSTLRQKRIKHFKDSDIYQVIFDNIVSAHKAITHL